MGTRGRRSAASLAVVAPTVARPRFCAPDYLSGAARDVWDAVVRTEAPGHFDRAGMRHLLEAFCLLAARLRALETELAELDAEGGELGDRLKLMRVLNETSGRLTTTAMKLRITPAARERVADDRKVSPYDQTLD